MASNKIQIQKRLVAVDTETYAIDHFRDRCPKVVCMSIQDSAPGAVPQLILDKAEMEQTFKKLLEDDSVIICGAEFSYDMGVLMKQFPGLTSLIFSKYEKGLIWDVLIGAMLYVIEKGLIFKDETGSEKIHKEVGRNRDGSVIYEVMRSKGKNGKPGKIAERFSLDIATYFFLDRKDAKKNDEWRLRYGELDGVSLNEWPDSAKQYPIDDVQNTLEVAYAQQGIGNAHHMKINCKAAFAMMLGSNHGLQIDKDQVLEFEKKYISQEMARAEGYKHSGLHRSDGVLDRVRIQEIRDMVGDVVPKTAKGGISLKKADFEESRSPVLREYADFLDTKKYRTTYIPKILQGIHDGVAYSMGDRPNVLLATGRASYSGLSQLYPPKMREVFKARAGMVLCSIDYAALELCTFAQICIRLFGYSKMADTINESRDPGLLHTVLGMAIAGRTDLEAFIRDIKAKDKTATMYRALAKIGNFGFLGGMGAAGVVKAQKLKKVYLCVSTGQNSACYTFTDNQYHGPTCVDCLKIANNIRRNFLSTWPEASEYFRWVKERNLSDSEKSTIITPITKFIRGGLRYTSYANHSFQHLAAIGTKMASWELTQECYLKEKGSVLYGSRPILMIHDEILSELPEEVAHEAAYRKRDILVAAQKKLMPDIHISAEPALMSHWNKKADTLLDSNGRLVVWEDKK